jgi:hypothetical protein
MVKRPVGGHFHGYAGPGYRLFISQNMALDMGAQYDFYSPIGYITNGISAKFGITFLFGRTQWPNQVDNSGEDTADSYQKQSPFYKWQAGDTLRSVSARVFGDPLLFSLLVDMNKELFLHPAMLRVGTELNVKARTLNADEIEAYHNKSLNVGFYTQLDKVSSRYGYTTDPDWKGPTRYLWKKYDTFSSVAEKIYGDEDLFPILVDANEKHLILPANVKPGSVLRIPAPPTGEWVDFIHQQGWKRGHYIMWNTVGQDEKENKPTAK